MLRIHLVRHGETDANAGGIIQGQSESQLTERGEAQATALGERLNDMAFTAVYCSTSIRARQTVARILGTDGSGVTYLDSIREIFLGPWEGRARDEVDATWPEQVAAYRGTPHTFRYDGMESFHDVQQRGVATVENIAREVDGGDVLVVSHGGLIKTVLFHFLGWPLSTLWEAPPLHNCSHHIIAFAPGAAPRVVQLNDKPYPA